MKYILLGCALLAAATCVLSSLDLSERFVASASGGFSKRRLGSTASSLITPKTTPVLTKQAFVLESGAAPVASATNMGMFFYIQNSTDGTYIDYDSTFKMYGSIRVNFIQASGNQVFEIANMNCQQTDVADVPSSMIFCPPGYMNDDIQTGDIEIYITDCNSAAGETCASAYRKMKFHDLMIITTGVIHSKLVMNETGSLVFSPQVEITNKFTIDNEHTIFQESEIIKNVVGSKNFFTYEMNYPYYALAQSTANPGLLFLQRYSLSPLGQRHVLQNVVTSGMSTLQVQVTHNAAEIAKLAKKPVVSSSRHPQVQTTSTKLGPTDGKFFMVSLNKKDAFGALNYYAEMQLGTLNATVAHDVYTNANKPFGKVDYQVNRTSTGADSSYDPVATQLMTLSTQRFSTSIVLNTCVNTACTILPKIQTYNQKSSSTCVEGKFQTFGPFDEFSPALSLGEQTMTDTVGFVFTTHQQITILKKFEIYGVSTVHNEANAKAVYASNLNGAIGLAPVCETTLCPDENLLDQALQGGQITNKMYSIYLDKKVPEASSLMVGTYDSEGAAPGATMNVISSLTSSSFAMDFTSGTIGFPSPHISIAGIKSTSVLFDPNEPMIAMNQYDFQKVQTALEDSFSPTVLNCAKSTDPLLPYCQVDKPCSQVFVDGSLNITFPQQTPAVDSIVIALQDLLIGGKKLNPELSSENENKCYVAIRQNEINPNSLMMVLGAIVMQEYYVVFDMTQTIQAKDSAAKNQIGFAKINPRNVLGASIYQSDAPYFDRHYYDASTSYDYTLESSSSPEPYDPSTDPNATPKQEESARVHYIMMGIIGFGFVIAFLVALYFFKNPEKNPCKKNRGQSMAYDDDAIHQLTKQKQIDQIKQSQGLMEVKEDELF